MSINGFDAPRDDEIFSNLSESNKKEFTVYGEPRSGHI